MSQILVVDSYALLAWINQEPGYEAYKKFLDSASWQRTITPITLFEVRLGLFKKRFKQDEEVAALAFVKTICETHEISEMAALRAAEIKYKYIRSDAKRKTNANISMADAIGIALAESLNAPLLSGEKGMKQVTEVQVLPNK